MLLMHVLISLGSVAYTAHLIARPTYTKVKVSYAFVAATIASGFGLIVFSHASMVRTCVTGLAFTTIVSAGILVARRRLQAQEF